MGYVAPAPKLPKEHAAAATAVEEATGLGMGSAAETGAEAQPRAAAASAGDPTSELGLGAAIMARNEELPPS